MNWERCCFPLRRWPGSNQ